MVKSMGPKTDPFGTLYFNSCGSDFDFLIWTVWVWPVWCDWNLSKTLPRMPNDDSSVWSKRLWCSNRTPPPPPPPHPHPHPHPHPTTHSGFTALMVVSKLPYTVILIHDLLHAHYEYAIMNYCIFTEWCLNLESWHYLYYLLLFNYWHWQNI